MPAISHQDDLKGQVRAFWNQQSCDTQVARSPKFSREYFEEIERFRYLDQPFIHSFAQFSRYQGKRVLEVGFGAGTDFIQWLRCGAHATGIDLTPEALENLRNRIAIYHLPPPERILTGDAETLPFETNSFDLGYSFGVLHHSPNTEKAVSELVRTVKPGGEVKLMLYNLHSIYTINTWVKFALLKAKPWKTLQWALWNHMESIGTKGYTRARLKKWLSSLPLSNVRVHTETTAADYLSGSACPPLNLFYRGLLRLGGPTFDWKPSDYVARGESSVLPPKPRRVSDQINFTGNRFGFFHCIYGIKQ